ncbi:transporter substrate-binding domain-containing protein [Gymnodinialimonas sp. 57CJ19]|uniref:ABC transporter substrate-binding protein n=1 Tax=Gymnodinialimonas sp. 57CJ19 TaxID=3138498 RepID=UPI0031344F7F
MPRFLALVLAVIAPLCAKAETLRLATSAAYPPMIIHNGAPPVSGLEGDLLAALCARAGWDCQWQIMPFDAIFVALEAGEIDIAANSLGYTAARAARVHMTCPYRPSSSDGAQGTFYVLDPSHDPRSGPIAVLRETLHATALARAGLEARPFSDDHTALDAVVAGDIPAYFGADPAVESYPDRGLLAASGAMAIESGGTSIAVTPLRPDLAAEVDAQLANLSRDGTITRLTTLWTGTGVDDPIALCDIGLPIS